MGVFLDLLEAGVGCDCGWGRGDGGWDLCLEAVCCLCWLCERESIPPSSMRAQRKHLPDIERAYTLPIE